MGKYLVTWNDNNVEQVLNLMKKYLEEHPSGEHISQSDSAHFEGIELLCDIADIVEPEYVEDDEDE